MNEHRTPSNSDTDLTQRRSGPVRFELIDKDGRPVASYTNVRELGEAAELYLPGQEQDEDRTGKGWDIQVVGS